MKGVPVRAVCGYAVFSLVCCLGCGGEEKPLNPAIEAMNHPPTTINLENLSEFDLQLNGQAVGTQLIRLPADSEVHFKGVVQPDPARFDGVVHAMLHFRFQKADSDPAVWETSFMGTPYEAQFLTSVRGKVDLKGKLTLTPGRYQMRTYAFYAGPFENRFRFDLFAITPVEVY